jgi:hypothetical protein
MKFFEMVYVYLYFLVAIIAGIILYPLSFLVGSVHYEESGYDY